MTSSSTRHPRAPALNLRLLGALDVEGGPGAGDDPHPLLRQPKRTAVLVYLMLEGSDDLVSRDHLVEVFWADSEDGRGRTSLRQTLSYLRGCLPEDAVLRRGNSRVGIDPQLVGCDLLRFESLLEDGRTAEALELCRGDLLEGLVVDAGEPFDAWLEARREAFRSRASDEAWSLASAAEKEGRRAEAAFWGKRALSFSTFDEPGVQRLMGLLARVGDRAGVLRAYRGLLDRLEREGGEVDPLTRRIAEEVRKLDPDDPSATIVGGGGRRSGVDRRSGEERRQGPDASWSGRERRRGGDRRSGEERRSGRDRRTGA